MVPTRWWREPGPDGGTGGGHAGAGRPGRGTARPPTWPRRPGPASRDAEITQVLVAADEGVQPDRVRPGHGDDQIGLLHGQPGHGVAAQADLVVEELLVLLEAEPGVDHRNREGGPEQLQHRLPGEAQELI